MSGSTRLPLSAPPSRVAASCLRARASRDLDEAFRIGVRLSRDQEQICSIAMRMSRDRQEIDRLHAHISSDLAEIRRLRVAEAAIDAPVPAAEWTETDYRDAVAWLEKHAVSSGAILDHLRKRLGVEPEAAPTFQEMLETLRHLAPSPPGTGGET